MTLNKRNFGLSAGLVYAFVVLVTTWFSAAIGGSYAGTLLDLIKSIYPGYSVSFFGGLLGAVYAFVDFFILFYVLAWIYNKLEKK